MVVAPAQPLARITIAALPVKAAKAVSPCAPFGDMARERRLADARVAEQAEHLRLARLEPTTDPVDRFRLLARPFPPDRLADPRRLGRRRDGPGRRRRFGRGRRLAVRLRRHRLVFCATARAGRRLAAEIVVFRAAGRAPALGSEPADRELHPGQIDLAPRGPERPATVDSGFERNSLSELTKEARGAARFCSSPEPWPPTGLSGPGLEPPCRGPIWNFGGGRALFSAAG